jgi:two-component system, NarL family, response regulator
MSKENAIRLLIVDDHTTVREGLAALLEMEDDILVVGQADNGREAIERYHTLQPDVTLMDLRMPEMDGVTAIETIRSEFPAARFIVLTTYDGDVDIYRGVKAGAQGYLLKDVPREVMLLSIRAVHAGQMCIPSEVAAKLAGYVTTLQLTEREIEVLRLVAAGKSNQEIGAALFIAEGTVKAHVGSILNKLGASDRTQAVMVALKRGILHLE